MKMFFSNFYFPCLESCVTSCAFADTSAFKCLYRRYIVEDHIRPVEAGMVSSDDR